MLTYPGQLAREKCAARTLEELVEPLVKRPQSDRDARRFAWMRNRCETCSACPLTVRALRVLSPPLEEPPSAQVFKLVG